MIQFIHNRNAPRALIENSAKHFPKKTTKTFAKQIKCVTLATNQKNNAVFYKIMQHRNKTNAVWNTK